MDTHALIQRGACEWEISPQGKMLVPVIIYATEALVSELGFIQSPMPILVPKAPMAHVLPVLGAMLSIVAALSRCGLGGFANRACSGTKVLTRRYSGPLRVR